MNRLGPTPASLILAGILAVGSISAFSGCATAPQSAPPTAPTQVVETAVTPSPTNSPTPEPRLQVFTVGHTNGLGAYLRRTPLGDKIKAWPEGAVMTAIGGDQLVGGNTWRNVRDPDGNEGWMVVDYLVPSEATPVPAGRTPTAATPPA